MNSSNAPRIAIVVAMALLITIVTGSAFIGIIAAIGLGYRIFALDAFKQARKRPKLNRRDAWATKANQPQPKPLSASDEEKFILVTSLLLAVLLGFSLSSMLAIFLFEHTPYNLTTAQYFACWLGFGAFGLKMAVRSSGYQISNRK